MFFRRHRLHFFLCIVAWSLKDNTAQGSYLCNIVIRNILFKVVLIFFGRHCICKNHVQCCLRASQHCIRILFRRCCLNTPETTLYKKITCAMLAKVHSHLFAGK